MKRYSVFHLPIMSFYSLDVYRDVYLHWRGTGFACLLFLLAVCWAPFAIDFHFRLADLIRDEAPKFVSQIPKITIVDGVASTEEAKPYFVREPESGEVLVVIDTTGSITSLADAKAKGLVTKTEAIFQKSTIETRTFSFHEIKAFDIDKERVTGWLNVIGKLAAPVIYPLVVAGSFVFRVIQVLIYAAIGMLFASWCKTRMSYLSLLRLAVVAVTPCIIIKTMFGMFPISMPFAGLWFFLIAMGYLFLAIRTNCQYDGDAVNEPN